MLPPNTVVSSQNIFQAQLKIRRLLLSLNDDPNFTDFQQRMRSNKIMDGLGQKTATDDKAHQIAKDA